MNRITIRIDQSFSKIKWSLSLGVFVGLLMITSFFAYQASFYAKRFHELNIERKAIDASLVRIETAMTQINEYKDRIDAITTSTVDAAIGDATSMEKRLSNVRKSLDQHKLYSSVEERQANAAIRAEDIAVNAANVSQTMRAITSILSLRKDLLAGIPSITPAAGWISSSFGERRSPFTGEAVVHKGIDIGAEEGMPIYAPADGVVETVAKSESYGNVLLIKHAEDIQTKFAHNSRILVKEGQKISRGEIIAEVGSTGRSTGPHVHYEVWVEKNAVDPLDYLLDREISELNAIPNFAMDAVGGEEADVSLEAALEANDPSRKSNVESVNSNSGFDFRLLVLVSICLLIIWATRSYFSLAATYPLSAARAFSKNQH